MLSPIHIYFLNGFKADKFPFERKVVFFPPFTFVFARRTLCTHVIYILTFMVAYWTENVFDFVENVK